MKIRCTIADPQKQATNVLLWAFFEDNLKQQISKSKLREISKDLPVSEDFGGKLGETLLLYGNSAVASERLLLVGLGPEADYNLAVLRRAIAFALGRLATCQSKTVAVTLDSLTHEGVSHEAASQALVETVSLGTYKYQKYKKAKESELVDMRELQLVVCGNGEQAKAQSGMMLGEAVASATNLARDLQNHPGNWLTPKRFANIARELSANSGLRCEILGKSEIASLKMEALLGVAKGSSEPPRFIILEHRPKKKGADSVVLVGKGITFDTGGISIKPSDKMDEMKFDMSGASSVLAAMKAMSDLKLPVHVVGLIPCAENMPSSTATRPGDILRASSGTTIEVLNTDAEGRLILADALNYARRYKPKAVVDLATLTGACIVALGHHATAVMGNDQELMDQLLEAGERTGERLWQLPLWQEYYDDIKSDYADIKNSAGRAGGAITAAAFLGTFAKDYPWAHLDIAGTAWVTQKKDYFDIGGTGIGVRLLVDFLRRRCDSGGESKS